MARKRDKRPTVSTRGWEAKVLVRPGAAERAARYRLGAEAARRLTIQQAADILNISRPFLIKLLDEETIPYSIVGKYQRIQFSDLLQYQARRDADRRRRLAKITEIGRKLGL